MDHCLSIGVERFIVNTHHCAAAYDETFPDGNWRGTPILFRHEPVLLDTAGGLKNIEDLLEEDETILVYNGDILSDLPLSRLLAAHAAGGREVTLALRSDGPLRNVCLDARGEICDFRDLLGNPGVRRCLFSGISVVEKRFLRRLIPGKAESTIPVFAAMIREAPGSVASVVIDEGIWEDVGDIPAYERIKAGGGYEPGRPGTWRRRGSGPLSVSGSPLETADSSARPRTVAPEDAGGATTVPDGEREEAAPEESAFIHRTLGLAAGTRVELAPVGKGGSDRNYFRVSAAGGRPVILMRYGRMYEENDRLCGRRLLSSGNRRDRPRDLRPRSGAEADPDGGPGGTGTSTRSATPRGRFAAASTKRPSHSPRKCYHFHWIAFPPGSV